MSEEKSIPAWPASLKEVGQALINLDKIWPIEKKNASMDPMMQWRKFIGLGEGVYDIAGLKGIVITIPLLEYEKERAEERKLRETELLIENYNKEKVEIVPVCRRCMITPMTYWQQECPSCMGDTLRSDLENVQHSRAEHRADCMEGLYNYGADINAHAWDTETPLATLVNQPGSTVDCMYPMKQGGPCKRKPRKTLIENSYCRQHYDMLIAEQLKEEGAEHEVEATPAS